MGILHPGRAWTSEDQKKKKEKKHAGMAVTVDATGS